MTNRAYDIAVIGGGILGLATAWTLSQRRREGLIVLEAESQLASHQTGHNSGVIHSGIYYRPGSLKARNCTTGAAALYRFCQEQGIPHERCGKLIVATRESELPALAALEERGRQNGLADLARLTPDEARQVEPHVACVAALRVGQTGIVDFVAVARAYARLAEQNGIELRTSAKVRKVTRDAGEFVLETTAGSVRARHLVNCAGLESDRVARMCGLDPRVRIVPFRGEYYELAHERRHLVKHLIYPVPDPRFPFLGVHFTRRIGGGIEAGPNAVLALSRRGYRWRSISLRDMGSMFGYTGFWRMAGRHWRMGLGEVHRSLSKRAYLAALRRLVPEVCAADLVPAGAGVRAQALDRSGALVDDFCVESGERMIHVLNAPSPAATASLAIGEQVAALALERFEL
jgi:L-2-hydroxyglutarate oxidase